MSDPYANPEVKLTPQRKRLIVCCDGTGQSSSTGTAKVATNVFRLAQSLKTSDYMPDYDENSQPTGTGTEIAQVVMYQTGIGADGVSVISKEIAKAFGVGLDTHVLEAYTFLASNYEPDDEIFLFGFSRGAFTVRAIASFICNAGLLRKQGLQNLPVIYDEYKKCRDTKDSRKGFDTWMTKEQDKFMLNKGVVIRFMGIWDTVGSLGVPQTWVHSFLKKRGWDYNLNESYGYHDTSLPTPLVSDDNWRAVIVAAYQALALDEERISFAPTLLRLPKMNPDDLKMNNDTGFYQCWFPGVHTDVGGGYERTYRDISDISFAWMIDSLQGLLAFRADLPELLKETTLDPKREKDDKKDLPEDKGWGLSKQHNELDSVFFKMGGAEARTPGEYSPEKKLDENELPFETREYMHKSVRLRWQKKKDWRPASLKGFEIVAPDESKNEWAYKWVKKDKNGKVLVEIPEADVGWGDVSISMLSKEDRAFFKLDEVPVENQ